jgi:Ca2+-binding RTX toxin-like protein
MSVIQIQATRAGKTRVKSQGREQYELDDTEKNNKSPFYLGAMILALTVFLKSVLVSRANAAMPPEHAKDPHDQSGGSHNNDAANANSTRASLSEISDEDGKSSSAYQFAPYKPSNPYYFIDTARPHSFDLAQLPSTGGDVRSVIKNGEPVNFSIMSSNDNKAVGSAGGGGNANTGDDAGNAGGIGGDGEGDGDGDDEDTPKPLQNRRPVVSRPVTLYDQSACIAVMIALSDLLQGATDPDGDKLFIRNAIVSSGELVLTQEGYRFHGEQQGPVTITYEISDGRLSVLQTARFNIVTKPAIEGTDGDDNLLGSDCEDDIFGKNGNDQIDGRGGSDTISGGVGNDHIIGGDGNDVIFGGDGDDVILGGVGDDLVSGGAGNDRLFGDSGNDILLGGIGDDSIYDGSGNDKVDGEEGDDTVFVSADGEHDLFNGGIGVDRVDVSASKTSVTFDLGAGTISSADTGSDQAANFEIFVGGAADDIFIAAGLGDTSQANADDLVNTFIGQGGIDTLDYSDATSGVMVNVASGEAMGQDIGTDTFSGIEHFIGGNGNDNFIVGEGSVTLDGASGNDMFEFLTTVVIESSSSSSHHIVGFEEGDWVRMSKYDIFESAVSILEDAFQDIYGGGSSGPANSNSGTPDEVIPIRIRYEVSDSLQKTFIDADFDHDDVYEISIQLDGHHSLLITNNQVA